MKLNLNIRQGQESVPLPQEVKMVQTLSKLENEKEYILLSTNQPSQPVIVLSQQRK